MGRHQRTIAALTITAFLCGVVAYAARPVLGVATTQAGACTSQVRRGVLPEWARGGFSDPKPRMPHVLGASGRIVAILWAYPLISPAPRDHNNKILWVSRVATDPGSDLRIRAQRMDESRPLGSQVTRRVMGGPNPSIINLPSSGCWRLTLRWSGHVDTLDLQYASNR
ncbi:MAG TPA: hypothetical protein VIL77_08545 [Gaiellaceae bacterium]